MKKLILTISLIAFSHLFFSPALFADSPSEVFGPTAICDNLKNLADLVRNQETVTAPQMMLAILKNNPHAFYRDNVNGLILGSWLYIPTDSEAQQLSPDASKATIDRQNQEWALWLSEMEKTKPDLYNALHPSVCSIKTLPILAHRMRQTTKPVVLLYVDPAIVSKNPMSDSTVIQMVTALHQQIDMLSQKNQELQNQLDSLQKSAKPLSTIPAAVESSAQPSSVTESSTPSASTIGASEPPKQSSSTIEPTAQSSSPNGLTTPASLAVVPTTPSPAVSETAISPAPAAIPEPPLTTNPETSKEPSVPSALPTQSEEETTSSSQNLMHPHLISLYAHDIWDQLNQWVKSLPFYPLLSTWMENPYWLAAILMSSLLLLCFILWWAYRKCSSCQSRDKPRMAVPVTDPTQTSVSTPGIMKDYSEYAGNDLAATKLDLAKAYIDMEEWGRAKEILKNVLETGNKVQKIEAEILFKEMTKK